MWEMMKVVAAILFWVSLAEATDSGWKPLLAPPGMYLAQTAVARKQEQQAVQEYRIDRHPEVPAEEGFPHQDSYTIARDEYVHAVDSTKGFSAPVPIHGKRQTFSYSSFNTYPWKKPGRRKELKYIKSPFNSNYIYYHNYNAVGFGDEHHPYEDRCPLHKVSFRQDLYFQYMQYKVHMPDLKEFTLCLWSKFHNHSFDHPLFSYAVRHQAKAIYMWVSNTERSNYYNMKINGHPIFRLNYPIRLNKWYHTCQSWNSKTGEWQVWVDGQRIGRGFHNLLVGHVIPGGGIAISGQEQLQYGGGFLEAGDTYKGTGGFLGEITMVQMYRIALSPGKAYTDHRHHHSHFTSTTPEPPEFPSEEPPTTPEHPFLENGQLKKHINVLDLAEKLKKAHTQELEHQVIFNDHFDGHFGHRYYSPSFPGHYGSTINVIPFADHKIFKRQQEDETAAETEPLKKVKFITNPGSYVTVEKIKFSVEKGENDEPRWSEKPHRRKRGANETVSEETLATHEEEDEDEEEEKEEAQESRDEEENETTESGSGESSQGTRGGRSLKYKRRIRDHGVVYSSRSHQKRVPHRWTGKRPRKVQKKESLQESETRNFFKKYEVGDFYHYQPLGHHFQYQDDTLAFHSDQKEEKEPDDNPLHASGEDVIGPPQPEPAEHEVLRIMSMCSGCSRDPYRKVAIISWKATPKKLYSGALFLRARPECRKF